MAVDVMTPHYTEYYQGKESPHDSGFPNPIFFLTVPPGSEFAFYVTCDRVRLAKLAPSLEDKWKVMMEAAFVHAFQWLGFGAKTSVGYGAFRQSDGVGQPEAVSRGGSTAIVGQTTWRRARLHFNANNGTLTATGPQSAKAHALAPRGQEIMSGLPEEFRIKLARGQIVFAVVHVQGADLISVEPLR